LPLPETRRRFGAPLTPFFTSGLTNCRNIVYIIWGGQRMEAVIQKWGNSLGIRIPHVIVKNRALKNGSFVEIKDTERGMLIMPKQKHTLAEMLHKITDENIHQEIETGEAVGKEIW
jgi:antitoxin MazE